jgi:hypothetical protein
MAQPILIMTALAGPRKGPCPGQPAGWTLTITNESPWELVELHVTPAARQDWGPNLLARDHLRPGWTLTIENCADHLYDLRVADELEDRGTMESLDLRCASHVFVVEASLLERRPAAGATTPRGGAHW